MPRRRILYAIASLEQGGAERQLAELIRGLDTDRFEPFLALCNTTDQLGYDLPVGRPFSLEAPGGPDNAALVRLVKVIRDLRPDIVHTYMGAMNIHGRFAARAASLWGHRPRAVSSVRCTRLPRKEVAREVFTHALVDRYIVNSAGIRDELVHRAHLDPARIDIIENGVSLTRFAPLAPAAKADVRREYAIEGARALLMPGRVCAQKNQLSIVRALAMMKRRGTLSPDLRVLFAGRGEDSSYGVAVKALARVAGLGPWVRFLGVVSPIQGLLASVDGVLLPSYYEGLPNVVLESMACGTPAIVSPAANTDRLVVEGREGLTCAGTDPDDIAAALERFQSLTPAALGEMGQAGRAHASERFAVGRMVARTMDVYDRLFA
jgi:glycosyltransferase involved in cell wall biosynthesis